jgi:hypothetical protein
MGLVADQGREADARDRRWSSKGASWASHPRLTWNTLGSRSMSFRRSAIAHRASILSKG